MEYIIPTNKKQAIDDLIHCGDTYGFISTIIAKGDTTHIFFIHTIQSKEFYDSVLYLDYIGFHILMKHGLQTSKMHILEDTP